MYKYKCKNEEKKNNKKTTISFSINYSTFLHIFRKAHLHQHLVKKHGFCFYCFLARAPAKKAWSVIGVPAAGKLAVPQSIGLLKLASPLPRA